jgi:hypothetical protein
MTKLYSITTLGLLLTCLGAQAALTPEEAKKLGTTLTAVGAEKAGNADGSIPAYTGGLTTPPAGFKPVTGIRPDPFAGEKPLFSITAKNMDQYAARLTEGNKALLKKYATYRLDIYPTHRTVALPKYVLDGTAHNALSAQTVNGGLGVRNLKSGFPFPIPKDGYEAMWNHQLRYEGERWTSKYQAWNVDAAGRKTLSTESVITNEYPFYYKQNPNMATYLMVQLAYTGPARRAGEALMVKDPLNIAEAGRKAWQYLPGQRRVKLAPDIAFDTPNPGSAGATTYDEAFVFNGSMERYNFKLVGKKEMYIPYNEYKMLYQAKPDDLFLAKHLNPDAVRWELHRVWVVEATLKPGKRHIYSKRIFYLDEDCWAAIVSDSYDARGQIFRTMFATQSNAYEASATWNAGCFAYDLIAGNYSMQGVMSQGGYLKYGAPLPASAWNPESLAGSGIR